MKNIGMERLAREGKLNLTYQHVANAPILLMQLSYFLLNFTWNKLVFLLLFYHLSYLCMEKKKTKKNIALSYKRQVQHTFFYFFLLKKVRILKMSVFVRPFSQLAWCANFKQLGFFWKCLEDYKFSSEEFFWEERKWKCWAK